MGEKVLGDMAGLVPCAAGGYGLIFMLLDNEQQPMRSDGKVESVAAHLLNHLGPDAAEGLRASLAELGEALRKIGEEEGGSTD